MEINLETADIHELLSVSDAIQKQMEKLRQDHAAVNAAIAKRVNEYQNLRRAQITKPDEIAAK